VPIEKFTSESPAAYAPGPATPGEKPGPEESFDDGPAERSGPSWPVVPILAWMLTLGAVGGGVYVLIHSLGGGPETAEAAPEEPQPEPPNIEKLISVIGGARSARPDLPNPFVRPGGEGDKTGATTQPTTGPTTAPAALAPPAPIPGVSPDDWTGPAMPADASLTDEQAAAAFTLQGYVFSGDKRCAINGRLYRQGDRVGRFVIGHILEDGVVLHNGDFATLLRMKR
jgi:hypothetical protein